MQRRTIPIVDGDGHVFEDFDAMWEFMPAALQPQRRVNNWLFPQTDQLRVPNGQVPPAAFDYTVDAAAWVRFIEDLGLSAGVLFPTRGLAVGRIVNLQWARAACHAYNSWLHDAYLTKDARLKGMGLVSLQDPAAAAAELRHIVNDLGMCGAMLPAAGYKGSLGDQEYWPLYRAADELGCTLAVHGGSYAGLGLDGMSFFAAAHSLGHPYGILNAFTSMTFCGVFDAFPNVRFGFLEAGVGWLMMALERFDGSYKAFTPWDDPDGRQLRLRKGESVSEHLMEALRGGRIFVGVEGEEPLLSYAVKHIGRQPFVFSSDFPHEVNTDICRHEIEEILEHPELDDEDKEAILHGNAERFYGLTPAHALA
jgi:predicted TIM-barrel fold metal-dependent hydrolase